MSMTRTRVAWGVASFVALAQVVMIACSSDPDPTGGPPACAPATRACTGEGGCAGTQTCNADGTYSACVCPATDAAPADVQQPDTSIPDTGTDAGPWNPRDMTGLVLWLDGSKGVVEDPTKLGKIYKWQDRSGNSNDAFVASAESPSIVANAINGKGAVNCDQASYLSIPDNAALKFGTGDFGIMVVAKATLANNTGPTLFEKGVLAQITGESSLRIITSKPDGGEAFVAAPVNAFSFYVARGTKLEVRAGGKTATGPKTTVDVTDTNPAFLCRGTVDATAVMAEVMVVKGALSDNDIAQAQSYVKTKYGF